MSMALSPTAIQNGLKAMIYFLEDFEQSTLRKNVKSDIDSKDIKDKSVIAAKSSLSYVPIFDKPLERNPLLLIMTLFLQDKAICSNIMRALMSMGRDQMSMKFWRIIIGYSEGLRHRHKDSNESMISKGLKAYSKQFSELTLDTVKTISLDSPCKETDVSKIRVAWLKLGDEFLCYGMYDIKRAVPITGVKKFIVEGAPFFKLQDGLRNCVLSSIAGTEGVGHEPPDCDYQPDPIQSGAVGKEGIDDLNFDNDDYIIRPDAHFRQLENLEKSILEGSYFFQCKGEYDRILTFSEIISERNPHCALEIRQYYHLIARSSRERWEPQHRYSRIFFDDIERCHTAVGSLLEDYFILCRVLDNFDFLSEAHFCSSYYTIIVHHHGLGEIVKIERTLLIDIKDHMELVIRVLDRYVVAVSYPDHMSVVSFLPPEKALFVELGNWCWKIMQDMGLSRYPDFDNFLFSSKVLSKALDLGLVAYVGSHGSRFDLNYLDRDLSPVIFEPHIVLGTGVIFRLQKLACLNEFMDNEEVWMFSPPISTYRETIQHDLSLLTDMECFADLWGPVWTIPAGDGFLGYIQYYVTSKGIIRRVPHGTNMRISCDDKQQRFLGKHAPYAKMCHWYSREAASQLELGNVGIISEEMLMMKGDKLLIGSLSENHHCTYTLDCLEKAVGLQMIPLGTEPSSWCLDTRTLGISAAHMVGISVMGTQKLRPKTTLKQHIYDKMNNSPTRANPQLFNLFLGVEISHCTGNARRIRVRDLFSIKTLQSALTNRFPDWMNTNPGLELLAALETPYDNSFIELWRSNAEFRPQIAELLCCILEVLDKSGISGDTFQVGYINHGKEYSMSLEIRKNNWANLLQDSERTAVYAIINENCLECHARGHSTGQCSSAKAFTVLETRIALHISQPLQGAIWLGQQGSLNVCSGKDDGRIFVTWESGRIRRIRESLGGSPQIMNREVFDPSDLGGRNINVFVRSSEASYGGLAHQRNKPSAIDRTLSTPSKAEESHRPSAKDEAKTVFPSQVLESSANKSIYELPIYPCLSKIQKKPVHQG